MKTIVTTLAILFSFITHAQESNPFYIGHSLVNHTMPYMVQALATNAGRTTHYGRQIINGSPLQYNYNNPNGAEGTPYTTAFPSGNFNRLVITEAVPLQSHLTWSNTYGMANAFYNYAKANNGGVPIKFYIYETWHCTNSGIPNPDPNFPNGCWYDNTANSTIQWQPRLTADFPLWSGIVMHVRNQHPGDNQIWMVPAGQAFYNLTTQINAGTVPGITSYRDLFSDDIHLTNAGNYFVACVQYATIYGQSPVGLAANLNDQWGVPFTNMPTPAQALVMQQVAWNTVTSLSSWTGVFMNTLPVTFSTPLRAEQKGTAVHLTWSVAGGTNNSKYIVEHSSDARTFSPIGELSRGVSAASNQRYEFPHRTPSHGANYYRIKQIDADGKYSYSNVADIDYKGQGETLTVFPNPASDKITVVFKGVRETENLRIYNATGLLVKEVSIRQTASVSISDLPPGVYLIHVKNSPGNKYTFVKN